MTDKNREMDARPTRGLDRAQACALAAEARAAPARLPVFAARPAQRRGGRLAAPWLSSPITPWGPGDGLGGGWTDRFARNPLSLSEWWTLLLVS